MSTSQHKRVTMVKDRVGVGKKSTRNLPNEEHVYGYTQKLDQEGAGDLISNWVTANPTEGKDSYRSHVHGNILALKNGCVTSKAFRIFSKNHQNLRMKEILTVEQNRSGAKFEGPFGIKTEFSSETMEDLVQAKFTHFENDDPDYPNMDGLTNQHVFVAPRPTKASLGNAAVAKERRAKFNEEVEDEKQYDAPPAERFIMKKFKNIPAKVDMGKPPSARPESKDKA